MRYANGVRAFWASQRRRILWLVGFSLLVVFLMAGLPEVADWFGYEVTEISLIPPNAKIKPKPEATRLVVATATATATSTATPSVTPSPTATLTATASTTLSSTATPTATALPVALAEATTPPPASSPPAGLSALIVERTAQWLVVYVPAENAFPLDLRALVLVINSTRYALAVYPTFSEALANLRAPACFVLRTESSVPRKPTVECLALHDQQVFDVVTTAFWYNANVASVMPLTVYDGEVELGRCATASRCSLMGAPVPVTPAAPPAPAQFRPLPAERLQGRVVLDMAAAGGQVWFATDQGLLHAEEGANRTAVRLVAGTETMRLDTVAVDGTGATVWFNVGGAGTVGRYLLADDRVDVYTPPGVSRAFATAIQVADDGGVWFGYTNGRLLHRTRLGDWEPLEPPAAFLDSLDTLHVQLVDGLAVLRITGLRRGVPAAWQWQDGRWREVMLATICAEVGCVINGVLGDSYNRSWFGHSAGVTVYRDDLSGTYAQRCAVGAATLQADIVLDMALTAEDLWVVTRSNVARLEISPARMPDDCAAWQWTLWTDDTFFTGAANYRLAVDETTDGLTVWLIEAGSNRVRWLAVSAK